MAAFGLRIAFGLNRAELAAGNPAAVTDGGGADMRRTGSDMGGLPVGGVVDIGR